METVSDTTRVLASIEVIEALTPIEGADRIVKARVKGWDVVVKKDEFVEGDLCCFFEIDSILPSDKEWAEFMAPRKYRVKTCKMRGVTSQGLALPIDILPQNTKTVVGQDVTDLLGVEKWEEPPTGRAEDEGARPGWVPKTDEIRVQSEPERLDELKGHPYYISTKYDGQSGSFGRLNGEFVATSRARKMKRPEDVKADVEAKAARMREEGAPEEEIPNPARFGPSNWWVVARKYDLENKIPDGFVVQGEVYGPGIQKNRLESNEVDFAAFNVFNVKEGRYLDFKEFVEFCQDIDVPTVEILETGNSFNYTMEELIQKADGKYAGTNRLREGIVIRSQGPVLCGRIRKDRISFKAISNKYLLKYDL